MRRCLYLAVKGLGTTRPNPSVGCLIVYKDVIIGEGFTSPYGGPHAEVNAINSVKDKTLLKDSTLYVTLEPCSHHGKTPPCSDLIIESKIPIVVIGTLDTNEKVSGQGIDKLKKAISNNLADLKHIYDLLPQTWFAVKENLETMHPLSNSIGLC